MTIEYLLKKKKGVHLIYIALYQGNDQTPISTGETITLFDWDRKKRRPKDLDSPVAVAISKIKDDINKIKRLMIAQDVEVTPKALKRQYQEWKKQRLDNQKVKDEVEVENAAYVTTLAKKYVKDGIRRYAKNTQRAIRHSIKLFREFLKGRYPRLERGELTKDILDRYDNYLEDEGYSDSSHGLRTKHLRWFLDWIGWSRDKITKVRIRGLTKAERNKIMLDEDELQMLHNYDSSDSTERQKAKDYELLVCYTGLRGSDMKRIDEHRIINEIIDLTTQKNRTAARVPLLPQAKEILQRYGWRAPDISETNVNLHIKEVCKRAGIDRPTYFMRKQAGKLIETLHPKHELISIHAGIKTFISMAGPRWGLRVEEIAKIVGKDVATVLEYYQDVKVKNVKTKLLEAEDARQKKLLEEKNRAEMKAV